MNFSLQMPWARQSAPAEIAGHKLELPKTDLKATAADAKRAVSEGADTIATVAADMSREAAKLGREAGKIGREAAKKASELAVSGEAAIRTLGSDARATVDDLRSYKIVKKTGPDVRPGLALLAGISAGIAAMFFLDPEHGRRRRVLLVDQLRKWLRRSAEMLDGTARDVRNRSAGLAHETRRAINNASEAIAQKSSQLTGADLATDTPDVSAELDSTDQAATVEYGEPTYVGERSH